MAIRYNDWQLTNIHADVLREVLPSGLRELQVWRDIPGIFAGKVTDSLRAGVYLQPLKSEVMIQYSSTQDIARRSLLVIAQGRTGRQDDHEPPTIAFLEEVRTLFANKRVTELQCELYSSHESSAYTIDDTLSRKLSVVMVELSTTLREDR